MTWSLAHTVPYVDSSSEGAGWTYLLDTYLPARTGWATSAHPSASAYKRSFNYTYTNKLTGASDTFYYWIDWLSATNDYCVLYEDATYTTTPGDLGTDSGSSQSALYNLSSYTGYRKSFKFWTSDENNRACLVTRGKHICFYWPGFVEAFTYTEGAWTAGTKNPRQVIMPMTNDKFCLNANAPTSLATGNALYYFHPFVSNYSTNDLASPYLVKNVMFGASQNTIGTDSYANSVFAVTADDTQVYVPTGPTTNRFITNYANAEGLVNFDGTDYWLFSSSALNNINLALNFGITEPDFT